MKRAVFLVPLATILLLAGCSQTAVQNNTQVSYQTPSQTTQKIIQPFQFTPDMIKKYPQLQPPKNGDTIAVIETDMGTMKMRIFEKDIPTLTKNFEELVKQGKYTNVPFHRVVEDFMVQTGDFTAKNGTGGYSYKGPDTYLPNEINPNYRHLYGTVSMAMSSDPISIGSQFFIVTNHDGTPFLDGRYSPIGQIFEGMEVAEKIAALEIPNTEQPSQIVNIKKITLEKYTGS